MTIKARKADRYLYVRVEGRQEGRLSRVLITNKQVIVVSGIAVDWDSNQMQDCLIWCLRACLDISSNYV